MCIGLPMRVLSATEGRAVVAGRGETRDIETRLLGDVQVGDWLLVFIDSARERIDAQRAAEVNQMLDLLASAMTGMDAPDADFALPSAMSPEQLAALAGTPAATETTE